MNSMVKTSVQNQRQLQFITGKEQAETLRARLQAELGEAAAEVAARGITEVDPEQAAAGGSDTLAHHCRSRRTTTVYILGAHTVGARSLMVQARG